MASVFEAAARLSGFGDWYDIANTGYQVYRFINKRRKMDIDSAQYMHGTQRSRKAPAVGGHSVTQRGYSRTKYGKRPTKKAKLALKLVNSTLSSAVLRWQRIGKYELSVMRFNPSVPPTSTGVPDAYAQVPVPLGHFKRTDNQVCYPVVLFDLTSVRSQMANAVQTGNVGYVLSRTAPVSGVQNFFWLPLVGQGPTGFANSSNLQSWYTERTSAESGALELSVVSMAKRCYLDWVDVRMNLYGAKKQATNFTVSLIQFNDRAWDPENADRSADEQAQYDAAWDEFLKPKVFNPMATAGRSQNRLFKTLSYKKYTINPDLTNNEDDNPPNIGCKMFHHLNRVCKYDWADQNTPVPVAPTSEQKIVSDQEITYPGPPPPAAGAFINMGLDSSAYNQQLNSNVKPYVHPRAKVFLMVTAEAFTRLTLQEQNVFPEAYIDFCPSFDIVIRKKITFDSE